MNSRLLKQFAYGLFFILIFAIFVLTIYFLFLKPTPSCFDGLQNQNETGVDCGGFCVSCSQKYAVPLEISSFKNFANGEGKSILIAEVKNPNTDYAASDFIYSFEIYDIAGEKIKSVSGHSFIYAGETKYIFLLVDLPSLELLRKELVFSDYSWEPIKQFSKPNVQIKNYKIEINEQSRPIAVNIIGFVRNSDIFNLSKIFISAILFSKTGEMIGVSKTELENISPNEEAAFQIVFPKNVDIDNIDSSKTKIFTDAIR